MGLVYLPSIVMVGYYFEEKRAIATGSEHAVSDRRFDGRVVGRHRHGGHWNRFDHVRTIVSFLIQSIQMEDWLAHLGRYSSPLCCLFGFDGSIETEEGATQESTRRSVSSALLFTARPQSTDIHVCLYFRLDDDAIEPTVSENSVGCRPHFVPSVDYISVTQ